MKRVPVARCHGDFNPNNILISAESQVAGVVDWEYSQIGCALFDLFSIYRFSVLESEERPGRRADSIESIWRRGTETGLSFWRALNRYAVRFDLAVSELKALFAAYAIHSLAGFVRGQGNPKDPHLAPWRAYLESAG